jgi:hypothetical protein
MKRRLELNNASALFPGGSGASSSHSACIPSAPLVHSPQGAGPAGVGLGISSVPGTGPSRTGSDGGPALQLQHVIGTGSFGSVYLANWRGKQVAVKVMHLPADALMEPLDQQPSIEEDEEDSSADGSAASTQGELRLQQQQHRRRQQWQRQQNSPPHMAIMEAVVSSTMCHPNVKSRQLFVMQSYRCLMCICLQPRQTCPGTLLCLGKPGHLCLCAGLCCVLLVVCSVGCLRA